MPWDYETYRPRTDRYGAAYYGMLAGPPRGREWRYEPPTNSRDGRRSEFDTASRRMHRGERSQRALPKPRRAASEVPTYHRHHRPPPLVEGTTVPYALQPPNYASRPSSRRPKPVYQAEPEPRHSSQRPISSGYYIEPSNLSVPSSMHVQVGSSRNSSVPHPRPRIEPLPHDRIRGPSMFDMSHASREGRRNELRQAARDFDRREHDQRGQDYSQTPGRWYERGVWSRLRRGERRC